MNDNNKDPILVDARPTLRHIGACDAARAWADQQAYHSAKSLWDACPLGLWTAWLLKELVARSARPNKQWVRFAHRLVAPIVYKLDAEPRLAATKEAFHKVEGWLNNTVSDDELRRAEADILGGRTISADAAARAVGHLIHQAVGNGDQRFSTICHEVALAQGENGCTDRDARMGSSIRAHIPWEKVERALLALYDVRDPDYPERNEVTLIAAFVSGQPVTQGRLRDLLCVGLEGGIGYWGRAGVSFDAETTPWPGEREHVAYLNAPLRHGGQVLIHPHDDKSPGPTYARSYPVDRQTLVGGLQIMARDYASNYQDFINGDEDAITGDVFLQCVCFGKLVFS